MTQPCSHFHALAAQAARNYCGLPELELRPLDAAAITELQTRWTELTARQPNDPSHHARDLESLIRVAGNLPNDALSYGLWHEGKLLATALINTGSSRENGALAAAHIAAQPGPHALQGKVLATMHRANLAIALAKGDEEIIYCGGFSPGSVKQVERGAIPGIGLPYRNAMWRRLSLRVELTTSAKPMALFEPGKSPLPGFVAREYYAAYEQLFGHAYTRPAPG